MESPMDNNFLENNHHFGIDASTPEARKRLEQKYNKIQKIEDELCKVLEISDPELRTKIEAVLILNL